MNAADDITARVRQHCYSVVQGPEHAVVTACTQSSRRVCQHTIVSVLAVDEANIDRILQELRAAAGRHTVFVTTAYNNPRTGR